jgi:predicted dinucleotide-binding enzyme
LVGVSPPCGVCDVLSLAGALPQGGNMVVGILVAWAVLLDWNSTLSEDDSGALSVDSVLAGSNVVAGYDTLAAAGG